MDTALEQGVRRRAGNVCEYCLYPEAVSTLSHVIDHIIARQHGGQTSLDNLALCCGRCNLYKGPNIAGLDPETGRLERLFHPRQDVWNVHFGLENGNIVGLTSVGRTTVAVLGMNKLHRVSARLALIACDKFPRT